jgi:hypothetical protein
VQRKPSCQSKTQEKTSATIPVDVRRRQHYVPNENVRLCILYQNHQTPAKNNIFFFSRLRLVRALASSASVKTTNSPCVAPSMVWIAQSKTTAFLSDPVRVDPQTVLTFDKALLPRVYDFCPHIFVCFSSSLPRKRTRASAPSRPSVAHAWFTNFGCAKVSAVSRPHRFRSQLQFPPVGNATATPQE